MELGEDTKRRHNGIRVGCGHLGLLLTSRTWKWQVSQAEKVVESGGVGWIRWRGGGLGEEGADKAWRGFSLHRRVGVVLHLQTCARRRKLVQCDLGVAWNW